MTIVACKWSPKDTGSSVRAEAGGGKGEARAEPASFEEDFDAAKAATWPADGGPQPEDFTVLFPVDFSALRGIKSEDALRAQLQTTLVPLSAVMSEEVYARIMGAAQGDYAGAKPEEEGREANPIVFHVKEKQAEDIASIPLANWFVVGLRLSPCSDTLGLPEPALSLVRSKKTLRAWTCRPQVRLTAQPFGLRRVLISESPPKTGFASVTDDKSLHLVFDFTAGTGAGEAKAVLNAEKTLQEKKETLFATGGPGQSSSSALAALVEDTHPREVLAALEAQRRALLARVAALRGKSSGALRIPNGAGAPALARYAAFVRDELTASTAPRAVTQNFSTSGVKPDTAEHWVFAAYDIDPARELNAASTPIRKRVLSFLSGGERLAAGEGNASDAGAAPETEAAAPRGNEGAAKGTDQSDASALRLWTRISLQPNFSFSPTLRGVDSLDLSLTRALSGKDSVRDAVLARIPERTLARGAASGPGVETDPSERSGQGFDVLSGVLTKALSHVNNPERSNLATLPCSACHLADSVRERLRLSGVGESAIAGNRPVFDLGRPHVDTSFGWNFRQLGYFESTPSIGDRLARETDADVRYARGMK